MSGANRRISTLAALLALALLATGCTTAAEPPRSTGHDVIAGDTPNQDVLALPADFDKQLDFALDELPQLAESALDQSGVPGMAVAVVHGDKVVFAHGYGVAEMGSDRAVTTDTVFQIASLSKPLSATGVAAAIGASEGELGWDTPIRDLLPGFALADPLVTEHATVGDAFGHRTGLATGAGDDLEDLGYDRATILDRLSQQPLSPFRSSYHYSNFGLTIGAEAVAASRGEPWEQLMDELVFAPLGMASSSARHDDFIAHEGRARLHALEGGEFVSAYDRDPDPQSPAGGISSTANDLSRWLRMLLADGGFEGKSVADPEALAEAMTPQTVSGSGPGLGGRPAHYGYGFNASPQVSGRMAISHSGAFVLGAASNFQIVPDLDLAIVVLTNGAPVGVPEAVTAQFLDLVQFGHTTRDWVADAAGFFAGLTAATGDLVGEPRPADPAAPPAAEVLVGTYDNPYFGPLVIAQTDDGMVARLGPGGATQLALEPWEGATFVYAPSSESAPFGSRASAAFTANGGEVRLESFDEQGLGTWVRRR